MNTLRKYAIAAVVGLLLLAAAATFGYCARDRRAQHEAVQAARTADAVALRAAGALAAERVSRAQVEAQLGGMRADVERLKNAVPGTHVVEVVRWRTETIHAGGTPLPAEPVVAGCGKPTFGGADRGCVLRLGDLFRIDVDEVRLETENGAKAITAEAAVIRTTGSEESLGKGKIRIDASRLLVAPAAVGGKDAVADAGRPLFGGGLGLHDGLGGAVPMAGVLAVGRPIKKTAWRPYISGAIGLSTVRVGNEERRPVTAFAGFVR